MLKLLPGVIAGAFLLVFAIFALGVVGGMAGEHGAGCAGQWMVASWYGPESGNRTANGEHFNGTSLTAAHRSWPFGTRLRVTYHGKSVVVRINDRGPAKWTGASLDLSRAAARRIGLGKGRVCVERL